MRRRRSEIDLGEIARLIPAAGVAVVWIVLMFRSGGFHPGTWLPAGIVLAVLLGMAVLGGGHVLPERGDRRTALVLLIAFTGWCFVSLAWSEARGPAWEAANLLLVAVLGAWTLALAPWRTRTAQALGVALALGAAAACLVALLSALAAADLTSRFEDFRFSPPLDYPNSSAAFAFMAAIPALLLAARPDASIPAKALAQGLATFLCAYALLPQSRGSLLGGAAAVVVLFAVVGFRWRLLMHMLLLAAGVAFTAEPVADVYTAASQTGEASAALRDAFTAMLLATAGATALGTLLALAEDRLDVEAEWGGIGRRAVQVAGALAVVAVIGVGVVKAEPIGDTVSDQWDALTNPGQDFAGDRADAGGSRLTSTDPLERYDYWRVALDGFGANPIGGMGAGGFEQRYALERRYPKPSRYPHNVFLKVLGDTGAVGAGLLIAFLVVIGRGLLRARARTTRERVVAATALATLAYFLAHGSFDWLEAYPVLAGPALALPLVALAVRERADRSRSAAASDAPAVTAPSRPWATWAATGAVLIASVASLAAPWVALRYQERGADGWQVDAGRAYRDLDRAASLNPFDPKPLVLRGVIGLTRGDAGLAADAFRRALDRQQDWLPHLGLALLAADAGDRDAARTEIGTALELHPEDPVLPQVAKRLLSAGEVDPAALLREALAAPNDDVEPVS